VSRHSRNCAHDGSGPEVQGKKCSNASSHIEVSIIDRDDDYLSSGRELAGVVVASGAVDEASSMYPEKHRQLFGAGRDIL
jgi:hypothetical protein